MTADQVIDGCSQLQLLNELDVTVVITSSHTPGAVAARVTVAGDPREWQLAVLDSHLFINSRNGGEWGRLVRCPWPEHNVYGGRRRPLPRTDQEMVPFAAWFLKDVV